MALARPFFLSLFLPISVAGLLLLQKTRLKQAWLLLCSALFLAFSLPQGGWLSLGLLLGAALLPRLGKKGAIAAVVWALGGLLALKLLRVPWPLGFSFIAIQGIAYALEILRGGSPGSLGDSLLYLSFFPKVTAGPVCRFSTFSAAARQARVFWEGLAEGLRLLILGLGKKLLLAENLLPLAQAGFQAGAHPLACLTALLAAPLFVYFDFSGYTDIARGAARMLGVTLPENFRQPFQACSLRDFWRRWHISLSSFLRDALYIPLGGSRRGKARTVRNLFLVFLAMGLWHGFSWPYLLFGLWHACFTALEHLGALRPERWPRPLARGYTLCVAAVGFMLFLAPSLPQFACVFSGLFHPGNFSSWQQCLALLSPTALLALAASACLALFPFRLPKKAAVLRVPALLLLLIVCYAHLLAQGYSPFLYAQF